MANYYQEIVKIKREIRRLETRKEEIRNNNEIPDQSKQCLIISYIHEIANLLNELDRWKRF